MQTRDTRLLCVRSFPEAHRGIAGARDPWCATHRKGGECGGDRCESRPWRIRDCTQEVAAPTAHKHSSLSQSLTLSLSHSLVLSLSHSPTLPLSRSPRSPRSRQDRRETGRHPSGQDWRRLTRGNQGSPTCARGGSRRTTRRTRGQSCTRRDRRWRR